MNLLPSPQIPIAIGYNWENGRVLSSAIDAFMEQFSQKKIKIAKMQGQSVFK